MSTPITACPAFRMRGAIGAVEFPKRPSFPGVVLEGECPSCGTLRTYDLGRDGHMLSGVVGNTALDLYAYCKACGREWHMGSVTITVAATIAPAPAASVSP